MPITPQDPFDLERFVEAQSASYASALSELRAGRKRSHWSWYVLPQIHGLGSSHMAVRYAISGLPEAQAYLAHPILGARLRECVEAMNAHTGKSAADILGGIDALKFHSCLTLFARVDGYGSVFDMALRKYFGGIEDGGTIAVLVRQNEANRT